MPRQQPKNTINNSQENVFPRVHQPWNNRHWLRNAVAGAQDKDLKKAIMNMIKDLLRIWINPLMKSTKTQTVERNKENSSK